MFLRNANTLSPERLTARVIESPRAAGCRLETYRDGDTYNIDIALPGVDPADIDVNVERNVLTVRAARRHPATDDAQHPAEEHPTAEERPATECSRQVVLSDRLDTDELEARYDSGVLTLSIPVLEQDQPAERAALPKAA